MKIAQLLPDDKFSDAAYNLFEKASPNTSTYYVPKSSSQKELKYIKKFTPIFISTQSRVLGSFVKELLAYDLIVLHSLNSFNSKVVSKISKYTNRPKIIWIGMGYDYYDLIYNDMSESYLVHTHLIAKELEGLNKKSSIKIAFRQAKKGIKKIIFQEKTKEELLNYIDYFSPVLPSEYIVLKNKLSISAKYIRWNYGVNAALYEDKNGPKVKYSKKNILLGNSATLTNNHAEALKLIYDLELQFDQIICPLSYGDKDYREYITNYGHTLFNSKFKPLIRFMPLEEYYELTQSCPVVIMNHVRQQAGGIISSMLYQGATIFINKKSPIYDFYHRQGITIFTTDELEENPKLLEYRLNDQEIFFARNVLRSNFGMDRAIKNTLNLLNLSEA